MTHRTTPENRPPSGLPAVAEATIDRVRRTIIAWFESAARPLPWREEGTSAWAILVSEIMSQQTPVSRVEPRWREWMDRWPTPADLAQAPTAEVLHRWDRLGYPRRALRLQEAARVITTEHGGRVPATAAELERLPGIGAYTAAAVASFAHGERTTVLDTNVRRVLIRLFAGRERPTPAPSRRETAWASELVPAEQHREWNASVMEFGALICTARGPRCESCPLSDLCAWNQAGRPASATRPAGQKWAGTDRQLRGAIMGVLKAAHADAAEDAPAAVPLDLFLATTAEVDPGLFDLLGPATSKSLSRMRDLSADRDRVSRLIADLISDGLAERHEDRLGLPR